MPKVIINKLQYKTHNIGPWVVMWLRRKQKRMSDLGEELGISQQAVSYKIKTNSFSYGDMLVIFDYLEVPDEEILQVMKL
jgi:predicted transcriptional regulator